MKAQQELEGTNISYQAGIIDPPVIPDVLDGNSSPRLVTYVAGFSLIRAFRGYQV